MTVHSRDPIYNAINGGIKEDIQIAFDHERFRAAIILIYAGMDAMALLDMPAGQIEVTKKDFIAWADRYISFPCKEQITGADFYGARCSMLHAYGVVSRMSTAGNCRMIGYSDHSIPEVRYDSAISKDLVMVSIKALKDAFFAGIDRFLVSAFTDKSKAAIMESRLQSFILMLPFKGSQTP